VTIHQKVGKESSEWAEALSNIGLVYANQDKLELALEYCNRALIIHQKIGK